MDAVILELQNLVTSQLPEPSDVIVWLQGDQFDRAPKVLELWQKNFAPRILLSGNNVLLGENIRPGENNFSLDQMKTWLIKHKVPEKFIVVNDSAMNTREQAENVLALAQKNNWQKILLVGSTHHQLRPFLTFLQRAKEINWTGQIINQPAHLEQKAIPAGRTQTVAETFIEEVEKIQKYTEHVMNPAEALNYFQIKSALEFRAATMADSELLFVWRNDPHAYQNFFSAKPVTKPEHLEWLTKTLDNYNRYLFIILHQGQPIGQVRFDVNEESAEISITLAPDQRGQGLGVKTIIEATEYFLNQVPGLRTIIAVIKADNQASLKAFAKAGYKLKNTDSADSVISLEFSKS